MTSSRLPGKVLAEADGKPMLELMIERLRFVREIDEIVIATTTNRSDEPIEQLGHRLGLRVWRGSEDDVLSRVLGAATAANADVIVELTGDCPLIDPAIVSRVIQQYRRAGVDYVSNCLEITYPFGMETQVFARAVLADVASRTNNPVDREHVSLYIYRHPDIYSLDNVRAEKSEARADLRLTLDEPADLVLIGAVFSALRSKRSDFSLSDIIGFLDTHRDLATVNAGVVHKHV
jgi:spore coat polysaccharide biosynthesis protein SpsF